MSEFRLPPVRRFGVHHGLLTAVWEDGRTVAVSWPPPPPKDARGYWSPVVVAEHEDGSATALWRWTDGREEGELDRRGH